MELKKPKHNKGFEWWFEKVANESRTYLCCTEKEEDRKCSSPELHNIFVLKCAG